MARNSEFHAASRAAIDALRKGDTVRAESLVVEAAKAAEAQFGGQSPEYAAAQGELGLILASMGHDQPAAAAFRKACALEFPQNEQATRDRLTYLVNLGETLQRTGDLDEAEKALRQSVEERALFYGHEHPGYGFGLLPLALFLLNKGEPSAALPVIEETVLNFWNSGHERIAEALVVRAEILASSGAQHPLFPDLGSLPDALIEQMAAAAFERVPESQPGPMLQVLRSELGIVERRLGPSNRVTINLVAHIANLARSLEDHPTRLEALARLVWAADATGDRRQALQGVLGLALAQSEAGHHEEAQHSYGDALIRARELKDGAAAAGVLRNSGLHLAEIGRREEAEPVLRSAVSEARKARSKEETARSQIALGIFLQHDGRLEEARDLLAPALRVLDPAHPDGLCGRSHLDAILAGGSCGCGDMDGAISSSLSEMVRSHLPPELAADVDVHWDEKDSSVRVEVARNLNEKEAELLERAVRHSLQQLKSRIQGHY